MIRFSALTLRRGAKVLLDGASTVVHPGEKVGLVGSNGSGKSTLFALLRGEITPDGGDLALPASWRVAHVSQETPDTDRSAHAFALDGDTGLREIEQAIAEAEAAGETDRLADLHMRYGDADGYTAASRAEALLLGLGFSLAETREPVTTFSGGWRMRLALAQALMAPSDLLLLDEPTNHLDLDAIVWLEQWLRRYPGTALVVSHDREFLDTVCRVTVAIENRQLVRTAGNYSAHELQRAEVLRQAQGAFEIQQREIVHLQRFVDRFKAKASKAKQAQSRVKAIERMTLLAPIHAASPFTFRFRDPRTSPDPMLVIDALDCGYPSDDHVPRAVLHDIDLRITSGERIALLGANGQGKSTLVKTIVGTLAPLGGTLLPANGLVIGYFAQHQIDLLDLTASPLLQMQRRAAELQGNGPMPREQELRDYLGSFAFRGEMTTTPVATFSGGEKARLALALIVWARPNLLVLDEPTNHLDLETREALTVALAQFEGTLILVSHDRALLRATTERVLVVADGHVSEFDGDLDDYRDRALQKTSAPVPVAAAPAAAAVPAARTPSAVTRKAAAAERERSAQTRKPIEQRIRRIETKLQEATTAKTAIDAKLSSSDVYDEARKDELKQLLLEQAYLARDIEGLEADWLAQQALLDEAA